MSIFEKSSITNTEYNWFKHRLDPSFCIPDDNESKVIFGFNGIGKTTIFKCIKEINSASIEYLEYGDLKTQLIKGKDTLVISPYINQIIILRNQIEPLKSLLNSQKNIKDSFGFTRVNDLRAFGQRVIEYWRNKSFSGFVKSKSDIQSLEAILVGIPPKVFIGALTEISAVQSAKEELLSEKDHALFNILSLLDIITDPNDSICPVCENAAPNLKKTIQNKMTLLNNRRSTLIEKLKTNNITADATIINNLLIAYDKIQNDIELKSDYLLCEGNSSRFDTLMQNYVSLQSLETQLTPLLIQAQTSYLGIKNSKYSLESDLGRYFQVQSTDVNYDDINFNISIKFPREIKTYSTGELNLISFLYKVYSFIGSDKTVLLLDDPVSSLDLINHYKIAYEIVKNSVTRTMIVLTHSVEFINVVNSQYPNKFAFYYLEEAEGIISIERIPLNPLDSNPNIIILEKLSDNNGFFGFVEALKKRETNPSNASIQKLFHFTIPQENLDGNPLQFSNYDLVSLIENFTSFTKTDFYTDSFMKILYLCALRVWLEKKLFALIPSTDVTLQARFFCEDTLNKKIDCILPRTGTPQFPLPAGLSRDILMSKKVMLNQGVHYNSQILPFAYAINLSLDMLKDEILELKTLLP